MKNTAAWNADRLPSRFAAITAIVVVLAAVFVAFLLLKRRKIRQQPSLLLFILAVVAGICCNALFCGTLSTPHDRYQARVVWLMPVTAAILAISVFGKSTIPPPERLMAFSTESPPPSSRPPLT